MLTKQQIEEIIADKGKFSEFVSASMILALEQGLQHTKREKTPLSAVSNFIETLRKTRADLTGDSHENKIPQMMVNIQFGQAPKAVSLPIEGETVEKSVKKSRPELLEQAQNDFDDLFGPGNIEEEVSVGSSSTEN